MAIPSAAANQQTVGNIGLFYVCYRLSRLGWNVMPTSRNARGVDIVIYSQDASRTHTIQVKTLSKGSPVPLGTKLDHLFADFVVVTRPPRDARVFCIDTGGNPQVDTSR